MFDDPGICFCWSEFKEKTTSSAWCDDEPDNGFVKKNNRFILFGWRGTQTH